MSQVQCISKEHVKKYKINPLFVKTKTIKGKKHNKTKLINVYGMF